MYYAGHDTFQIDSGGASSAGRHLHQQDSNPIFTDLMDSKVRESKVVPLFSTVAAKAWMKRIRKAPLQKIRMGWCQSNQSILRDNTGASKQILGLNRKISNFTDQAMIFQFHDNRRSKDLTGATLARGLENNVHCRWIPGLDSLLHFYSGGW